MHTRRVEYRGFQREDGLWDIEGELHDTKPHAFEIEGEGVWAPHEAIHHMSLRVTVDDAMVIRDRSATSRWSWTRTRTIRAPRPWHRCRA
jgi:Protein of unknown function (DUF2889)